jgi:hypothetical protein
LCAPRRSRAASDRDGPLGEIEPGIFILREGCAFDVDAAEGVRDQTRRHGYLRTCSSSDQQDGSRRLRCRAPDRGCGTGETQVQLQRSTTPTGPRSTRRRRSRPCRMVAPALARPLAIDPPRSTRAPGIVLAWQ